MNTAFMQYLSNIVQLERTIYEENLLIEGLDAEICKEIPRPHKLYQSFNIRWKPLIPILIVLFAISLIAAFQSVPPMWSYFLICPAAVVFYILVWFVVYLVKKSNINALNQKNNSIYNYAASENETRKLSLCKLKEISIDRRKKTAATLKLFYDRDLIYPKYRSFEQVTQIYEYLDSGRCSSLTGYAGAYNLLEAERANHLILLELRQIRINTAQIVANQHLLYNTICDGLNTISALLSKSMAELKNISSTLQAQGNRIHTDMLEQRKYLAFIAENTAIPTFFRENYYHEQKMTRWLMEHRDLRSV